MARHRQKSASAPGFSLLELMIGLAISVFISIGLLSMWLKLQSSTLRALEHARLNQDLQAIGDIIANDVRRAGYRAWTPDSGLDIDMNPFLQADKDITIDRASAAESEASCLTYSYDLNQDGQPGGAVNEFFGFRLHEQRIEIRVGGTSFNCQQGSWQDITQAGTVIDTLRFNLHRTPVFPQTGCTATQPCITRRLLDIYFSGHLATQAEQTITVIRRIRIANDLLS